MPIRDFVTGADPARWADALCDLTAASGAEARRLFCADTVTIWNPEPDDLHHAELHFLLGWWRDLAAKHGGLPPASVKLDPLALRPALGHVCTLVPEAGGTDFRFRLYGSHVAVGAGFDMTGKLASAMPSAPDAVAFLLATYRAVSRVAMPLYTEHTPWSGQTVTRWFRLLMPFAGEDRSVARIVVGNLPGANRPPSYELLHEMTLAAVA
jgi:hypothetical protein